MAVRIIDGVPGSGKSYYAVKHLSDNYFEKQKDGRFELVKDIVIITNIDDFQPEHIALKPLIKELGVKEFFSDHFQRALTECLDLPIVYIIDEAQKYFRKGARDLDDVFTYFEYHRHYGHDIYLITQNAKKLPPDLVLLTEYIITAAPRSRSVIGEFKYKWLSDGELLKREGFKPDSSVFALYKSMDRKETEKVSNPVMKTVFVALLSVAVIIGAGLYYFKTKWGANSSTDTSPSISNAPSSSTQPTVSPAVTSPASVSTEKFVILPSTSVFINNVEHVFIVFHKKFIPLEKFPYKIEKSMGSYYASLPATEIESGENRQQERRNDSASGSAHGPVVVSADNELSSFIPN